MMLQNKVAFATVLAYVRVRQRCLNPLTHQMHCSGTLLDSPGGLFEVRFGAEWRVRGTRRDFMFTYELRWGYPLNLSI